MKQALFLLFMIIGIMKNIAAMEEPYTICKLCHNGIIDNSSAVLVYEQAVPCLVHRFCFNKYLAHSPNTDEESNLPYTDSGENFTTKPLPFLQCLCNFDDFLQFLDHVFGKNKRQ